MAFRTLLLNPNASMEQYILDKHYFRKHGKNAYYGQKSQ
jgi:L-ribulose-5-phosphate 4-epimerase